MKHLPFLRAWAALGVTSALVLSAHAAVTNVAWYRLGENDPGAASGQGVNGTTIDFAGANNLRRLGSARYTNDVLPDAAQIGSGLAVLFTGTGFYSNTVVATTARNNFGIEAWVRILGTGDGTYHIAYNGSPGANGWGIGMHVTNNLLSGLQISYFGELGGGIRIGPTSTRVTALGAHLALVRDNGTNRFYLQGSVAGSASTTTPATPAGGFAIGGLPFFPGVIDEVRVFTFAPGQFNSNDLLVNQPVVTTLPESELAAGTATLNGSASSVGFPTTVWFEWGALPNLNNITPLQSLGSGVTSTNFKAVLADLAVGTYQFRAVGSNSLGIVLGSVREFNTGPFVETLPATNLSLTIATLNGVANPNGLDTSFWFEWGSSTNYGNITPLNVLAGAGSETYVSQSLTGLTVGVVYHYRAVASNALAVVYGTDESFPILAQIAYLKASNTGPSDQFGSSVALSGDTLVIGAPDESSNATGVNGNQNNEGTTVSGAAYVFVRKGNSWRQEAYLKASNTGVLDSFGRSVAISGNTIVVGAPFEASNATGVNGNQNNDSVGNAGAAYVFVRTGTNWSQQAYLKAADAAGVCSTVGCTGCTCLPGDAFGLSVGVSGDTVVIGAPFDDSNATGVNGDPHNNSARDSGAAYVFVRNGTNWAQQAYLKASNAEGAPNTNSFGDNFGIAVAVSGNTLVVGAPGEDSDATTIDGDQTNNNARDSGAAYVFVRAGTNWSQQAYLKANSGFSPLFNQDSGFGGRVAVDADTAVVGAAAEFGGRGAAYVFARSVTDWSQQSHLQGDLNSSDYFGTSVSISGNLVVIGAPREDSNAVGVNGSSPNNFATDSGAAYAFRRSRNSWVQQAYLKASNAEGRDAPDIGDMFGAAVTVSGRTVVVGANFEGSSATGVDGNQFDNNARFSGAAYVFDPPPSGPEIRVEEVGGNIINDTGSATLVVTTTNTASSLLAIRNIGNADLVGVSATIDGVDAAAFSITSNPAPTVAPSNGTFVVIRFAPTSAGAKTATLHIASNDEDENPFNIQLSGLSLSFNEDRDGDGLNDATELLLVPLGFNFRSNQTSLVSTLFNNLGGAVSNLNTAGLFTPSQLQALKVNSPLLTNDPNTDLFKLTIGVERSSDLSNFFPFPMAAAQATINAEGKLEFRFSAPDNAAFFRLEGH